MKIKCTLNKSIARLWTVQNLSISLIRLCALMYISKNIYIPAIAVTGEAIIQLLCTIVPRFANPDVSLRKSLIIKLLK